MEIKTEVGGFLGLCHFSTESCFFIILNLYQGPCSKVEIQKILCGLLRKTLSLAQSKQCCESVPTESLRRWLGGWVVCVCVLGLGAGIRAFN